MCLFQTTQAHHQVIKDDHVHDLQSNEHVVCYTLQDTQETTTRQAETLQCQQPSTGGHVFIPGHTSPPPGHQR